MFNDNIPAELVLQHGFIPLGLFELQAVIALKWGRSLYVFPWQVN